MTGSRIQRDRKGGYRLRLPAEERELLGSLPSQFRAVLQTDDPSLRRLFPLPTSTTTRRTTSTGG